MTGSAVAPAEGRRLCSQGYLTTATRENVGPRRGQDGLFDSPDVIGPAASRSSGATLAQWRVGCQAGSGAPSGLTWAQRVRGQAAPNCRGI